jgi:hypothetical protein
MISYVYLWYYLAEFFLEWEIYQVRVVDTIKTHILISVYVSLNLAVLEIMWKNTLHRQRPQITSYEASALHDG